MMNQVQITVATVLAAAAFAWAGPLTPPAGPVTSTGKTLTEVEPRIAITAANTPGSATSVFRISQPGSYYLTGNVIGVAGKSGIEIASSSVTIDCNGFTLLGAAGSLDAITCIPNPGQLGVKNGIIVNWGGDGVDASGMALSVVEGMVINTVGGRGIVTGPGSVVKNCVVNGVAGGIEVADNSAVDRCTVLNSSARGIATGGSCRVTNCDVAATAGDGYQVTGRCVLLENRADSCGATAPNVHFHAIGTNNYMRGNIAQGIPGAPRGYRFDSNSNYIVQNTASNMGLAWQIVPSNANGPVAAAPGAAAISGASGPSGLGTTDPHANLTY
ncbi:hypothetical protein BH11PLA1_BH11PLA1_20040 [soil metagenome]